MTDLRLATFRRTLRWILLFGMLGVAAELLLIDHLEGLSQVLPLLGLAAAVAALAWDALGGGRGSRLALRGAMGALLAVSLLGLYQHFESNAEFQRELDPSLGGWRLAFAALRAQSPPALSPAVLALLGALGFLTTFRSNSSAPARS